MSPRHTDQQHIRTHKKICFTPCGTVSEEISSSLEKVGDCHILDWLSALLVR